MEKHMKGTKTPHKGWPVISTLIAITAWIVLPCNAMAAGKEPQSVIHQLRVYEIFDGNKKEFHDRFRDHAMRTGAVRLQDSFHMGSKNGRSHRVHLPFGVARQRDHERSLGEIHGRSGMDGH
jgi:hypothetical protein